MSAYFRVAIAPALIAVRKRAATFVAIQVCGIVLVVSYYASAGLRAALDVVAQTKAHNDVLFALVGSAVAGAVVPEVARTLAGDRLWTEERFRSFVHVAFTFAINGLALDLFYQFLAVVVGRGTDWATVLPKMACDMFLFTPFLSLPIFLVMVILREEGWNLRRFARRIDRTLIPDRVIPILIPCWCYWLPLQACLYSLPLNLQYPFALVCMAAWSLVLVFVAKRMDRAVG
jgi:hypothetical protein